MPKLGYDPNISSMSKSTRSSRLAKNAESALISAIEIYNKPDFRYREETFSILALNAWELLLKAKLLAENSNNPTCLYVYESRTLKGGKRSTKQYLKRNRAGNPSTIGLDRAIALLENNTNVRIPAAVKNNLAALTEIRDNAVHYVNAGPELAKQVLEIGTASVRNFIDAAKRWFGLDLSRYHLYLMPIGFVSTPGTALGIPIAPDAQKLLKYLASLVKAGQSEASGDYHVSLEVNLSFKRSSADSISVAITDDPGAPKVSISEEDIRARYPWDYGELVRRLKARYLDFKTNQKFHEIRKLLMKDSRFVKSRFLDPGNPRSAKKDFYNPNIIAEFDRHYTRPPDSGVA